MRPLGDENAKSEQLDVLHCCKCVYDDTTYELTVAHTQWYVSHFFSSLRGRPSSSFFSLPEVSEIPWGNHIRVCRAQSDIAHLYRWAGTLDLPRAQKQSFSPEALAL